MMTRRVFAAAIVFMVMAASAVQAAERPVRTFVIEIPVKSADGVRYTSTLTVNVFNPQVADMLAKYLERKPWQDGSGLDYQCTIDCAFDGMAWTPFAILDSVTRFISVACAAASGAAQALGYLNIYVDAFNALCASFTLTTEIIAPGVRTAYEAFWKQFTPSQPGNLVLWPLGNCGFDPVC